jgi:DNA-binding NtrC family response regulator
MLERARNVRIVATTHRALAGLVERGAFDSRLYSRLAEHVVDLPPLRSRPEDIIPLAERFAAEHGARQPVRLSPGALARLRSHPWPGNVLELRNAMERAVRLSGGGEILAEHLPTDVLPAAGDGRLREHVDSVERDAIVKSLADANHNQTHAAKRLGISRRALIYKMEKYGLKAPPGQLRKG